MGTVHISSTEVMFSYLLLAAVSVLGVSAECPRGFTGSADSDKCFHVAPNHYVTWDRADYFCQAWCEDCHLAEINNQAEQDLLESMLPASQRSDIWIGAYTEEWDEWYWQSGSVIRQERTIPSSISSSQEQEI